MIKYILWDLDGTLTDPRAGIIGSFQYALEASGLTVPDESELHWVIGPPIQKSFAKLAPDASESQVWRLVEKYRERFAEIGLFENVVYAGIPELLGMLGDKMKYVATSKPHVFAKQIISHFDLSSFFLRVYGSELDGRLSDKGDLIAHILQQEQIPATQAAIVGDRKHDILGAKKVGITSIGVTWGYGSSNELNEAGADHIFTSPKELRQFLLGLNFRG